MRLGTARCTTSAFTPGAVVSVNNVEIPLCGVLPREQRISRFEGGDEDLLFGLAVLCRAVAAEAALELPRLPCAEATRALSN